MRPVVESCLWTSLRSRFPEYLVTSHRYQVIIDIQQVLKYNGQYESAEHRRPGASGSIRQLLLCSMDRLGRDARRMLTERSGELRVHTVPFV